ncbi:MAG TPA: trehalose-6-phosphate synthase [Gammaproteobacteria bacterium]|nr:trehalose-6-phosphate synthase [Gammaproteobacteria bacterium]
MRGKSSGGLAVGVWSALQRHGGIWFGWSGTTCETEPRDPVVSEAGKVSFATIDLNATDFELYYNGFSNDSLWPLFHFMLGFFKFSRDQFRAYCRVNEYFARKLYPLLTNDDVIWVHDYHLIPLGEELRRAGVTVPIGFFLHVPFPSFDIMRSLPCYESILRALCLYDLIGFQTRRDLWAFHDCVRQPEFGGEVLPDGRVSAFGRTFRAEVFPIGIDVDDCATLAGKYTRHSRVRRLARSVGDRQLIIGVDRLDYSKGLELRFRAFEKLLANYPNTRGTVSFLQIAPPTRAGVRTYSDIRAELEQVASNVNGRYADIDWVPIRYLNKGYDRRVLMSLYRLASVGLVTPIRDGMNLVAKEYVASQDPEDPGALVLSTLAGASQELSAAVLINPYDRSGVADGIQTALEMPLAERQERYEEMIKVLRRNDIHAWSERFIAALTDARHAGAGAI